MKNITVTIPDETYLEARVWAAQNSTSVSALVRDFLATLPDLASKGATSASYTTPTVEFGADSSTAIGSFQVTVSNAVNSVTSNTVTLTAGPRSPKAGDLRYLLYQQADVSGLYDVSSSGAGSVIAQGNFSDESVTNGIGSPLGIGNFACSVGDGTITSCDWPFMYQLLPSPMTGLDMYYWAGNLSEYASDLGSYAASNVVFTSLNLEPAEGFYAVSWVKTGGTGGFDYRIDSPIPPGANQQAQIQAQTTLDGTESRVITAASFDASGNAVLISYGWQGDTTTVYEAQTIVVPPSQVVSAAMNLANVGYFISAFGGNDTNGYILVGMRAQGDTLPRPITALNESAPNIPTMVPYYTPVVYFFEYKMQACLFEQ
jgi:hypothetical protein